MANLLNFRSELVHCNKTCLLLQTRQRVNYAKSQAIYNEDMANKIKFIMRKNRVDPYPGC